VGRYARKRRLLAPRRVWMRRRRPTDDAFLRAALELHSYSRSMLGFIEATAAKRDILTDFEREPGGVVLDVGAYDGVWAASVLDHLPATLLAFEPDPTALNKLRARLGDRSDVSIQPYGLGGRDERVSLALEGPGSTMYAKGPGTFGTAAVEIRDTDAALGELGVEQVELIKLNIEGAEYDVFDRLFEEGWLPRCRHVLVQFHEWHPRAHPRRRAIRALLAETHDEVWCYPWVWECWERRES